MLKKFSWAFDLNGTLWGVGRNEDGDSLVVNFLDLTSSDTRGRTSPGAHDRFFIKIFFRKNRNNLVQLFFLNCESSFYMISLNSLKLLIFIPRKST